MSSEMNGRQAGAWTHSSEDPVDVRRYIEALRRSRWLIVAIVTIVTAVVAGVSETLPKNYNATASIVVNNTSGSLGSSTEASAIQRSLATTATVATTASVLNEAARSVPGETHESLAKKVSASVEENANIIDIKVTDRSGTNAAALAYAVAEAFIRQHEAVQRANTTSALSTLRSQIATLRERAAIEPNIAAEVTTLQARAAELEVTAASTASQLQLLQRPTTPSSPSSPRPLRNAAIAFFASIFLAILIALAREQFTPRVANQRELGQLLGLPVLAGIPYVGGRLRARYAHAAYETYQTLSAAIRLTLPEDSAPHVVLVTSATHSEGKTTVTSRLGRMLAQAGHPTLLVSCDLRWPVLDETFGVSDRPGLRQLLARAADTGEVSPGELEELIVRADGGEDGASRAELDVLPSGGRRGDPSELLLAPALQAVIGSLRADRYEYILIDSPPILGVADAQILAQFSDRLLLVARLDRVRLSDVIDLRELFDRIKPNPVGLVVIGTRPSGSPYYAADAPRRQVPLSP